jgi:hypothetical protein
LPFKCNLQRYSAALLVKTDLFSTLPVIWVLLVALIRNPHPVGLCRLNQVDR